MIRKLQQVEDTSLPLVSVSIVSHGDSGKVLRLLESVCTFERANLIQIIVTDNLGREFPEISGSPWSSLIVLRNEHKRGFASNHNHAFQFAKGKYICVLNPDVLFEQEVFSPLIELVESEQADIVAPLIVDVNSDPQDSFRKFPTPFEVIQRRLPGHRFTPPPVDVDGLVRPDWIAGIFMLMRSETYREIKGFDEKYRLYFEDVDLCARAQLAGLNLIVDTNVKLQHNANRASRKKLIYLLWHIQSAIRFFTSAVYKESSRRSK